MPAEGDADVLLVEDRADDVELFLHAFATTGLGGRIEVAHDAADALHYLHRSGPYAGTSAAKPKLIVLDLKLPGTGGLELLGSLKADSATRSIPVVVLSSSSEQRDVAESYALGANGYLAKSMDFERFGEAVQALLQYWLQFNESPKRY